jgi:hypothetical protein
MSSSTPTPPTYQPEEVQEILRLAIAQHSHEEELTRSQLLEIAQELAIPVTVIEQAEAKWRSQKQELVQREAFDLYRQGRFRQRTVKYVLFSALFVSLDVLSGGGLGWSRYMLLIALFVIAFNGWQTFFSDRERYEREFEQWQQRQQFRQTLRGLWGTVQKFFQQQTQ